MMIQEYIDNSKQTLYRISKDSGIPYNTLKDIYNGKTKVQNASSMTIYKLANYFGISMEDIMKPYVHKRPDFTNFKSNVCHQVKNIGDKAFIIDTLKRGLIPEYYERTWYRECFYLLAMTDYLSRIHHIPLVKEYNQYRDKKLNEPLYPTDVLLLDHRLHTDKYKQETYKKAIPEFKRYNLMEVTIRDAI